MANNAGSVVYHSGLKNLTNKFVNISFAKELYLGYSSNSSKLWFCSDHLNYHTLSSKQ